MDGNAGIAGKFLSTNILVMYKGTFPSGTLAFIACVRVYARKPTSKADSIV